MCGGEEVSAEGPRRASVLGMGKVGKPSCDCGSGVSPVACGHEPQLPGPPLSCREAAQAGRRRAGARTASRPPRTMGLTSTALAN